MDLRNQITREEGVWLASPDSGGRGDGESFSVIQFSGVPPTLVHVAEAGVSAPVSHRSMRSTDTPASAASRNVDKRPTFSPHLSSRTLPLPIAGRQRTPNLMLNLST